MDTLEFLRCVLPPEGLYVTTVINDGHPQQAFSSTVEDLAANCQRSDRFGNNTYYAISSFKAKGSRKKENVHLTKVIALDIDCAEGKAYLTQREGLAALLKFLTTTGLPKPMIVSSGRGLHVYWVLDTALPPAQWTPIAEAMKRACIELDLHADHGLTANSALVLRPTGTSNPKNGALVKVLLAADDVDKQALENKLQGYGLAGPTNHLPHVPPVSNKSKGLLASLAANQEFPPAIAATVQAKCRQIGWAVKHQKEVSEPLWYDLIGVAAHCADPEGTAKAWSDQHPTYSEAETLKKLRQWIGNATGPATCNKIEVDRPDGCKGCPMKGRIGSPAMLSIQYAEAAVSDTAPDIVAKTVPVPFPWKRVTKFGVTVMMQTIDGTDVDICPFELYPLGYGRDESLGYETVRYKWNRPHVGWQDLVFRQAHLNDESREFATTIADQGIVLRGKNQVTGFQHMLRAYMEELRKARTMTNIYGSMGWKDNFTQFVVGDKLYRREDDGSVTTEDISLNAASNRLGQELYGHKGSIQAWSEGTELLEKANLPWHMFALSQTFAAPLWALTGLKGLTISLYGPTGGGKSLIQMWQQSVWGDPEKLHFAAKFTQNALFARLGMYCNLPMTIDEATLMPDKEVGDFCYWVTQGRDKARLNRKAEERDSKEWATSVTVSTNRSFISKMIASGLDTDAQMARLLEVTVPPHKMFAKSSNAGRTIFRHITTNYGLVGDAYAKALLRHGKVELQHRIAVATAVFGKLYDFTFTGAERYWEQDLILVHVGCQIAHEEDLISYDYAVGIRWAITHLDALRHSVADNQTDGFKIINEYLNENAANVLVVMHTKDMPSAVDQNRLPRGEVRARFDVYRNSVVDKFDRGTVMLVQRPFKQQVSAKGYDFNTLRKEVRAEGIDATPPGRRTWLGRNTGLKLGQQYVLGISLNHPYMLGHLEDIEQTAGELTL